MTRTAIHGAGILAVLMLLVFPFLYDGANYNFIMHLWITGFFFAILSSSWALLAGYAGQFSFGHMAFMALGGYTTGLFTNYIRFTSLPTGTCTEFAFDQRWLVLLDPIGVASRPRTCLDVARETWPADVVVAMPSLWLGIVLGVLVGGLFGLLIGALVLRLRLAYLALFTVGFSEIVRATISAEIAVTRGQAGLELVPLFPEGVTLFGSFYGPTHKLPPYYVMLFVFLGCLGLMALLVRSRFGLFIRALREDEEAAQALGVNTVRYKILVFVITSMMAAGAGAVQAHNVGIITPNILIILQMSLVIAMAVIGGLENIVAAAIGAIIITFALELLRTSFVIGGIEVDMTIWRLVFFGLLLMLVLRFWRNGLINSALLRLEREAAARESVARRAAGPDTEADEEPVSKEEKVA
jgi:branched-chain amino acid transport system permease protein